MGSMVSCTFWAMSVIFVETSSKRSSPVAMDSLASIVDRFLVTASFTGERILALTSFAVREPAFMPTILTKNFFESTIWMVYAPLAVIIVGMFWKFTSLTDIGEGVPHLTSI